MATLHLKVQNRGVCPEFTHEVTNELRAVGDMDAKVLMRSRLGDRQRRRFRLEWEDGNAGQEFEVRTLFQEAGSRKRMNYVPPDETAIVEVRFLEHTLSIIQKAVDLYRMSFEVEEVLR